MSVFEYRGDYHRTMSYDEAVEEFEREKAKGKHKAIIDTSHLGGKMGEFIVVEPLTRGNSCPEEP